MATVEDQIAGLVTSVQALTTTVESLVTAVAAIPTAPVPASVDLTPVLTAIAAVAAQLQPTPAPAA